MIISKIKSHMVCSVTYELFTAVINAA